MLLVVGIGTLLSAMAGSTVTLALPSIGQEFTLSVSATRWVIQAYLVATTLLLLVAGRLGDLWSHRAVYLWGFGLFGAMSLAGGLAPRFGWLIGARVLQGIGGAMIMATGPALLTTTVPASRRGQALGIVASATYTGLTVGPPLGGLLIAHLGWRWVFYLNVPIAAVMAVLGPYLLPRRGAGAGADPRPAIRLRSLAAMVDFRLFRSRAFSSAVASALCNYVALFAPIILLPFLLVEGMHLSEDHAALLLIAQPLVMACVASPSGWLSDRVGSRPLRTLGMAMMSGGLLGLAALDAGSSHFAVVVWLALLGLGTGIFISPNSSALMGAAPRERQGVAGGVLGVSRNLGMLLGVFTATTVFDAAGGRTHDAWTVTDDTALHGALYVAAGVAALGAVASWLGREVRQPS